MQENRGVDSVSLSGSRTSNNLINCQYSEMEEYRLLVRPGQDICSLIRDEKAVGEISSDGLFNPEILIGVFWAREAMEDTLIRWIQRICDRLPGFPVMLNNYGSFPPHTIYLRVQEHQPFQHLITQLNIIDEYLRSGGSPGVKWLVRPHISIIEDLDEHQYERLVNTYAPKTFNASFIADELILEKRGNGHESCKLVNRFHLLPGN